MKWSMFFIFILTYLLFMGSMFALATANKNSLNYDSVEINRVEDVVIFLEECKTKIGMNCEKLLLDKIYSQTKRNTDEIKDE